MTQFDFLSDAPIEQPARKRGLSLGAIVLLVGVVAVAAVFGFALLQRGQTQPTSGPAPDFTLTTLNGESYTLSDLKGQVVIINFWASWCPPCHAEAPALQSVWEKYRDRGVVVMGVAYTDTESAAQAFIDNYGQDYPNGLDLGTKISDMYHIVGVPETFIIDKNGNVARLFLSEVNETGLSATLDELLGAA